MKQFLLTLLLFATLFSGFAQEKDKIYHILLLSTDGFSYPFTQIYTKSYENEFKKQGVKTVFIYESLNLYLFTEGKEDYYRSLISSFEMKYKSRQPDLVMAVEIASAEFLLKYGNNIFKNIPIITAGTSELNHVIHDDNWYQIMDTLDVGQMFATINRVQPQTEKVTVIIGNSDYEKGIVTWYKNKLKHLSKKFKIEFTHNKSYNEILELVANPKPNQVFYYLYLFEDNKGQKFIPQKVLNEIDKVAKAPIYVYYEHFVKGENILGGYVLSVSKFAEVSAQKSIGILKKTIPKFSLYEFASNKHVYNWKTLKKYNIPIDNLPPNSTVLYTEYTAWELYWKYIIGAFLLILFQTVLIIALLRNKAKRKKAEKEIIEINNRLEQTIETQTSKIKAQNFVLEKNVAQLKSMQEFKGRMISMIAHDLKNPLNYIINNETEKNNPGTDIKESAKQMLNLVCNMLEIFKMRSDKLEIHKEEYSLSEIIRAAVNEVKYQADKKNIKIKFSLNKDVFLLVDKLLMIRLFTNLLLNAVRFSPYNENIEISYKLNAHDKKITISIWDKGNGIAPEFHEKIFEPFTQFNDDNRHLNTTGLGLAFCKTAVKTHNGSISYDKDYTKGAKFDVTLNYLRTEKNIPAEVKTKKANTTLLSKEEKNIFNKIFEENNKPDIFEATAWRRIFNNLQKNENINKAWLNDLKNTVRQCNIEKFHKMINNLNEL